MMRGLSTLRREAQAATHWRGHRMRWSAPQYGDGGLRAVQSAECRSCGAWVQIDTHPPANGIDIGGSAVALECPIGGEE